MPNVILITMDEVRPDHLSCYGYGKNTKNLDSIADDGTVFTLAFGNSNLTPICHGSILSGVFPKKSGMRNPFCVVNPVLISSILKKQGYKTAGFVGNGLLGKVHGFEKGFDFFSEPSADTAFEIFTFSHYDKSDDEQFYFGNEWTPSLIKWIRENASKKFFVFGHYYHCHEGAEVALLRDKKIKKGVLSNYSYYDAKINYMDKTLFGPLVALLKEIKQYDNTLIIITADHGTTLNKREHAAPAPLPHRKNKSFPQHRTMYDTDLHIPLIIKLPRAERQTRKTSCLVQSVDIVPTILDVLKIRSNIKSDGTSLLPILKGNGYDDEFVYAEAIYEKRPPGAMQAIRNKQYKYIRNLTNGLKELYALNDDPMEKKNIMDTERINAKQSIMKFEKFMDKQLPSAGGKSRSNTVSQKEKNEIIKKLQSLGYIQ